jgi:hypothetical protein
MDNCAVLPCSPTLPHLIDISMPICYKYCVNFAVPHQHETQFPYNIYSVACERVHSGYEIGCLAKNHNVTGGGGGGGGGGCKLL